MQTRGFLASAVAIAAAAVWYSIGLLAEAPTASAGAALTVVPSEVDVRRSTTDSQDVELTLSNTGSRPLTIKSIQTKCACTLASPLKENFLEPGAQTSLHVEVHPPGVGVRHTSITIDTDQPGLAVTIPIVLRGAKVDPPFFREYPEEIRHNATTAGDVELPFNVACIERKGDPAWLIGFEGDSSRIAVSDPTVLTTDVLDDETVRRVYALTITLPAPPPAAPRLTGFLRPRTRSASTRRLPTIPVSVSRQPSIRAIPSAVVVSREDIDAAPYRRRIAIVSPADADWDFVAVNTSESWLTAEAVVGPEGGRFVQLEIAQAPPFGSGSLEASVEIETTHPDQTHVAIAVVVE